MKSGIEIIAHERGRQRLEENWSNQHDDEHADGELAIAAACYAMPNRLRTSLRLLWPWASSWWKPSPNDRIRELAKAGGLVCAEIDRLLRAQERAEQAERNRLAMGLPASDPEPWDGSPHWYRGGRR